MSEDGDRPSQDQGASRHLLVDDVLMALRLFSRLPTGTRPHEPPDIGRIAIALPFASLAIGMLPALVLLAGGLTGLPKLFVAGLAVGLSAIVTGAMSEDAIADAADGLFGGRTSDKRLEIMKDSRHGSYGVVALCLYLLLRVAALSTLADVSPPAAAVLWLGASLLARNGALWLPVVLPPARATGLAATAGELTVPNFAMGALFAVILGMILCAPSAGLVGFMLALALIALIAVGWADLCRRLIGGHTGDTIGALQALLEIAALGAFLMFV